jgi:hypothetical protein
MKQITDIIDAGNDVKSHLLDSIAELKITYKKILSERVFKEE